jgi:omega-amidase
MIERKLKIGICQIRYGHDIPANIDKAISMVIKAAGEDADIVVLPEMFMCPYEPLYIKRALNFSGYAIDSLKKTALDNSIYVVAGTVPWPSGNIRPYNRSIVIDSSGEELFFHDKLHLFDCDPPGGPKTVESSTVQPGRTFGVFQTQWGICSSIVCYDIRFTPLTQLLANMGTKILFVPAAFSMSTGPAHWEMLVRMRAIELQGYVVGVQPARNSDLVYIPYGHSIIAGPFGQVISDSGEDESVDVVEIDLEECDILKRRFPLLDHRRTDLYRTVWLNGNCS